MTMSTRCGVVFLFPSGVKIAMCLWHTVLVRCYLVPPPPPLPYFPLNPKPVSNCCVFSSVENNPRQAKPGFSRSEPCFQLKVGCPILKKYSLACNPRHCKLFENCALVNHSMISASVHTHRLTHARSLSVD